MRRLTSPLIPIIAAIGLGAGALASAGDALADTRSGSASVRTNADETSHSATGSITFRTERYAFSENAIVTTGQNTIRISDNAAMTKDGHRTGMYIELGYSLDPMSPSLIRVTSGVAIRGYDFATGAYDPDQAIRIGEGALALDSATWSHATHAWGHLSAGSERGLDLDIHGIDLA